MLLGGGCEFPDDRNDAVLWSTTVGPTNQSYISVVNELSGFYNDHYYSTSAHCRCVRFGEGETSEGSGNSFCYQLNYDEYDDWRMPTVKDIHNWIEQNGNEFIIDNYGTYDGSWTFWVNYFDDNINYEKGVLIAGPNGSGENVPYKARAFDNINTENANCHCFCVR